MAVSTHTTTFGQLLKRFRGRSGLTQAKLAERAGLSTDAITKLERGERQAPRCDTVQVLARALHLTTRDLCALEDAAQYTPRSVAQAATTSLCVDTLLQSLTELHAHHAAILDTFVTADIDPSVRTGTEHPSSI